MHSAREEDDLDDVLRSFAQRNARPILNVINDFLNGHHQVHPEEIENRIIHSTPAEKELLFRVYDQFIKDFAQANLEDSQTFLTEHVLLVTLLLGYIFPAERRTSITKTIPLLLKAARQGHELALLYAKDLVQPNTPEHQEVTQLLGALASDHWHHKPYFRMIRAVVEKRIDILDELAVNGLILASRALGDFYCSSRNYLTAGRYFSRCAIGGDPKGVLALASTFEKQAEFRKAQYCYELLLTERFKLAKDTTIYRTALDELLTMLALNFGPGEAAKIARKHQAWQELNKLFTKHSNHPEVCFHALMEHRYITEFLKACDNIALLQNMHLTTLLTCVNEETDLENIKLFFHHLSARNKAKLAASFTTTYFTLLKTGLATELILFILKKLVGEKIALLMWNGELLIAATKSERMADVTLQIYRKSLFSRPNPSHLAILNAVECRQISSGYAVQLIKQDITKGAMRQAPSYCKKA